MSALENLRVSKLVPMCLDIYDQSNKRNSTSQVNSVLKEVLLKHTPPMVKNKSKRIKFFYATQVGTLPPRFVIFCSHPQDLHFSYKRYFENAFREAFGYKNIPISIIFRERSRSPLDEKGERIKTNKSARFHKDRNYDDDIRSMAFDDMKTFDGSEIEFFDEDSEE